MYGSIKLVNSEKNLLYNFPYGPILELCFHMASILDFQYILSRIIQGAMRSTKVTFQQSVFIWPSSFEEILKYDKTLMESDDNNTHGSLE
jgi:hypothetical protein